MATDKKPLDERNGLTQVPANVALKPVFEHGIKPHTHQIARIVVPGDVAVVVYEPGREGKKFARSLGWDGEAPVFKMPDGIRTEFADGSYAMGDHVTAKWLQAKRPGRIFLIVHFGTLLVNFDPVRGWSLEPGSTANASA